MARIQAILGALVTAVRRDLKTVGSFSGNNLFVVGVASLFLGDPGAFVALSSFIGVVLFIPLSADPLRVLPRDRLAVWPLSTAEGCAASACGSIQSCGSSLRWLPGGT